jgi:hypothetical protein
MVLPVGTLLERHLIGDPGERSGRSRAKLIAESVERNFNAFLVCDPAASPRAGGGAP